jgi:hypothetical protein
MNSALWNRMGPVAIVLLLAILVLTYLRAKVSWVQALIVPALVLGAASRLRDPLSGIPLALGSTMALSLYGPVNIWIVRTLGVTAAIPAAPPGSARCTRSATRLRSRSRGCATS